MLDLRTYRSERNGIRVDVLRKYRHIDDAEKTKFSYKQIGSFLLSEGYQSELLELLQPEEVMQLQNWLAETRFAEQFNTEADELAKFVVRMPQQVNDALMRLYIEAKRVDIEFIPSQVMLDSLLHKAKLVQHKLDKINGFNSGILECIGIDTDQIIGENKKQELIDVESRTLFKALLDLDQPIGKTCTELEEVAKQYGKQQRIPPPQLREWGGDMASRNPNKRIKKWCYAIAIDVLLKHGINPIGVAPAERVATYWAIQRLERFTLEEAQKKFIKDFHVPTDSRALVVAAIESVYRRIG